MRQYHTPALLQEVLANFNVSSNSRYIDATLGGGSHTAGLLNLGGKVLAMDQDGEAINHCLSLEALKPALASRRLILVHSSFTKLQSVAIQHDWQPVSGILIDLGLSSHHLDADYRGFSFQSLGPLDMRMDNTQELTAKKLIETLPANQLASIFRKFGEVPPQMASSLAKAIKTTDTLDTTTDLASITKSWSRQVFQALRIAVNDELGAIEIVLPQAFQLLSSKSILQVISFHSLEDQLVATAFDNWSKSKLGLQPYPSGQVPTQSEVSSNPRVKSAKLRTFIKF
jgi:16S rRNA (cytosine1402-N4)-methyltransferase